jgi:ferredoxin
LIMPQGDGTGPAGDGARAHRRGCGLGRGLGRGQGQGRRMRAGKPGRSICQRPTQPNAPAAASPGRSGRVEHAKNQAGAGVQNHDALRRCDNESEASNATPVACVDEEACTPCGACQAVCPTEAITLGDTAVNVNRELCCGCGACVEACPNDAIKVN